MTSDNYCVIMAGGIGSRLWPMSRKDYPKQFHDVFGSGRTLLQQTYDRYKRIVDPANIIVSTNLDYSSIVKEQLPELRDAQILHEPAHKGTAASIAYVACHIRAINPKANIVVAQADQLILNEDLFVETVTKGLDFVASNNKLLIIGIKPTSPETRYGYVQAEEEENGFFKVRTFTEKPQIEFAKLFMESGEFYWNSGIYLWNVQTIVETLANLLPEMMAKFEDVFAAFPDRDSRRAKVYEYYSSFPSVSIDYTVMEKADNVYLLIGRFGWADLGTWNSLYTTLPKDGEGNVVIKSKTILYNSKNNIIVLPKDKLAVVQDMSGYLIADNGKVLLICKKDEESAFRKFMNDVQLNLGEEYV